MVKTTFKKLLKSPKYHINKKIVISTLTAIGYKIKISSDELEAFKIDKSGRYHMIIELYSNGEIYKGSEISLHEDIQYGPGHPVKIKGYRLNKEFNIFQGELIKQCKKYKQTNQSQN
ncbi:MAG: hypothetical protein JSW00_18065 [Thermoplasmata archaeon]|nr:MAG: hypothetical protein JSW00_18065 [Thermoplasmata archaeon]